MLSNKLSSATSAIALARLLPSRPFTHPLALPPSAWSLRTTSSSSRGSAGTQTRRRRLLSPARAVLETVGAMGNHDMGEAAGWPSLLMTCGLMFIGAYGCGMLPRWLPNQQRLTAIVGAVGAGLLLGSALCIILPEGFEAALEAEHPPPGWALSATLLSGFWLMLLLDSLSHWLPSTSTSNSSSSSSGHTVHRSTHRSRSDADNPDDEFAVPLGGSDRVLASRGGQNPPAGSSDEHTVLLTDFEVDQDQQGVSKPAGYTTAAAAAAAAAAAGGGRGVGLAPLHTPQGNTPSRGSGASPRRTTAAAKSGGSPAGSPRAAAAAAAGASLANSSRMSVGGVQAAAGATARRLAAAGGSSAAAAADGSNSQAVAAGSGYGGGFDGVCTPTGSNLSKELQGISSGSGPVSQTGRKGVGVSPGGVGGEWWRPWSIDPTHHALLGLLVHSVSDGLAVGAASLSTVPEVSLGVAAATVVHKGPVAIGLASFLRGAVWSPAQIHRGVLLFAVASPLAAVLTYGLLSAVPGITDNIPLVVLFSGGTVLYAATMHILPGAMRSSSGRSSSKTNQHHEHGKTLDREQLLYVTLGMLIPLVLSAAFGGHDHHHH